MNKAVTEQELIDSATAPRVTEDAAEANIKSATYFTAADGLRGACGATELPKSKVEHLELLTICVLTLKNGFTVLGQSACASPENFNWEIGQRLARADAKAKIWAFMGYELRTKLMQEKA